MQDKERKITSQAKTLDGFVFDRKDWASAYCNVEEELNNFKLNATKGVIPKGLCGTFYRNGPGRLERSGQWVHHPFDGDGMIASFTFKNGSVSLTNRFVRTEAWEAEEKAGKFLFRGVFGTQKPGGLFANTFDLRLKNIANTNVIKLGDKLLALWEAAGPHALDPTTLKTFGLSDLNGALKPGEAFSAHPRFDPGHNGSPKMVTFSVKTGPKSTIRLMEFSTTGNQAGELINERKDSFKGFSFLHDFAITPNWAIFLQNSLNFNPIGFILGQKGAAQCLSSNKNKQGKFIIIPRKSGDFADKDPIIINAPDGFVFHHLNAFENNNNIIVDSIYYKDFPSIGPDEDFRKINFDLIPEGVLKRCTINISNKSHKIKVLSDQCCEFAMANPSKQGLNARFSWMASSLKPRGNAPLQAIKKLDLITNEECFWSAGAKSFVSEPLFVPNLYSNSEDEGWILVLIWNAKIHSTELIILNATNLEEKAIIKLPIAIPHGLHGSWVNE